MQRAPDCDMSLVHDDDLVEIDELGHGREVSGLLIACRTILILAVAGNTRARNDDGPPPEVQSNDS